MAENGVVARAEHALSVSKTILPELRSPFSKHVFLQPQLLAVVCLMRYEGWSYRQAETALVGNDALRKALKLEHIPDYSTLCRFRRRTEPEVIECALARMRQQIEAERAGVPSPQA